MDRQKIVKYATKMQTKVDLLKVLNSIKKMELEECGLSESFRPITIKQLNFYCNPKHTFHRYKQFEIPKKSGGVRTITAPRRATFRFILSALNELFKSFYTPSDYAMGFTEGRSVVTNAEIHKSQNYVFNIDLKDFFPSIRQARVWKRIQLPPFNFPQEVANIIAGLCAMQVKKEDGTFDYVLPQGAPTSPILTNMVCDNLDRRLGGLAKRFGLHYTRYADDITFSSMHYVYHKDGEFRKELQRIINEQGFVINDKKTRLQKRGTRQEVTGIILSDKLNVTQQYAREVRQLLYIWERYGYAVALMKFLPKYKAEKKRKGHPDLINVLGGKLLYLKMVKGEEDSVYRRLFDKYSELCAPLLDVTQKTTTGLLYMETYLLKDFEKKFNTSIEVQEYQVKSKEDKTDAVPAENSKSQQQPRRYAYFFIEGNEEKQLVAIRKNVRSVDKNNNKLAISLCQKGNDKPYWLIHFMVELKKVAPQEVTIEELNTVLDNLLSTLEDGTTTS